MPTPTPVAKYSKVPERNATVQDWTDALAEEQKLLNGHYPHFPAASAAEAFAAREHDFRCCCCGAYVSLQLTGYYDSATCVECGHAQEVDEDEYTRVANSRYVRLARYYRSAGKSYLETLR